MEMEAIAALASQMERLARDLQLKAKEAQQEATCAKNELAAANRMRREMQQKLTSVQEYIQQMLNARQEIESRFYAMKDDLMTRLHLACAARDEARGQVLELQAELEDSYKKILILQEQIKLSHTAKRTNPTPSAPPLANAGKNAHDYLADMLRRGPRATDSKGDHAHDDALYKSWYTDDGLLDSIATLVGKPEPLFKQQPSGQANLNSINAPRNSTDLTKIDVEQWAAAARVACDAALGTGMGSCKLPSIDEVTPCEDAPVLASLPSGVPGLPMQRSVDATSPGAQWREGMSHPGQVKAPHSNSILRSPKGPVVAAAAPTSKTAPSVTSPPALSDPPPTGVKGTGVDSSTKASPQGDE